MYKSAKPLFLVCETPMHVGSGSDLGIIDLPIQRERHTGFPKIESSSLKGALREAFETAFKNEANADNRIKVHRTFGHDTDGILQKDKDTKAVENHFGKDTQYAGALALTDARLLLYPVKSLYGVFAWITCPRIITQFINDLKVSNPSAAFADSNPANKVPHGCTDLFGTKGIQLEEYLFTEIQNDVADGSLTKLAKYLSDTVFANANAYWKNKIANDIIVLGDDDFKDFVTMTTEVVTRTKIDNATGTVQSGALFTEEYLPAESILYSLVMFADEFTKKCDKMKAKDVETFFKSGLDNNNNIVQIGANMTLGKGITHTIYSPSKQTETK